MFAARRSGAFKRDMRKAEKRGKDMTKLHFRTTITPITLKFPAPPEVQQRRHDALPESASVFRR